jgi:pimeloyl-ACP methyl ester carboxylesterase
MAARRVVVLWLVAAVLVTSCSGADGDGDGGVQGDEPSQAVSSSASEGAGPTDAAVVPEKEEDVDIGGARLYFRCWGAPVDDEPTVLLLAGFSFSTSTWDAMAPGLAADGHHVCTYDRLGIGRSDRPAPDARRTLTDQVADLQALLEATNLSDPLVLVAHSAGSLPLIGFAGTAPDRVAGVVMVDGLSPRVSAAQRAALPPPTPGESAALADEREFLNGFLQDPDQNVERLVLAEQEAQAAAWLDERGPLFGDAPVVVLQARVPSSPPGLPPSYTKVFEAAVNAGQVEFAAESTRGERIKIESGHNIHEERPELVIDAILDVLAP